MDLWANIVFKETISSYMKNESHQEIKTNMGLKIVFG
jgi:hypothetical protein